MREHIKMLVQALRNAGEASTAEGVEESTRSEDGLTSFLVSNELWGGSGSIADQGGISSPAQRKEIERVLVGLGEAQIACGTTNPRTAAWVSVFKSWSNEGI